MRFKGDDLTVAKMTTIACVGGEQHGGRRVRQSVRNMVVNIENVLGNLQGVVGDLRVLLNQIENVSNKLHEQYGADWFQDNLNSNFKNKAIKNIPARKLDLSTGVLSSAPFAIDNKYNEVSPELDFSFLGITNYKLYDKWGGRLADHISLSNDSTIFIDYNFPSQPPVHPCSRISEEEDSSVTDSRSSDNYSDSLEERPDIDFKWHKHNVGSKFSIPKCLPKTQTASHAQCEHSNADGTNNAYCSIYEIMMESQLENSCSISDTYTSDSDFEDDGDISSSSSDTSISMSLSDDSDDANTWVDYSIKHTQV